MTTQDISQQLVGGTDERLPLVFTKTLVEYDGFRSGVMDDGKVGVCWSDRYAVFDDIKTTLLSGQLNNREFQLLRQCQP